MGLGGISPVQLIIILVIVLLIFGTKKLRSLGGDLGGAIKGFKKAVKEDDNKLDATTAEATDEVDEGVEGVEKVGDKVAASADETTKS